MGDEASSLLAPSASPALTETVGSDLDAAGSGDEPDLAGGELLPGQLTHTRAQADVVTKPTAETLMVVAGQARRRMAHGKACEYTPSRDGTTSAYWWA